MNEQVQMALSEWQEITVIHEDNVRFDEFRSHEYMGILRQFDMQLWRTDVVKQTGAKTIWDAIKIKYFPQWLLAKFPATIVTIDIRVVYPELSKFPDKVDAKRIGECKKYLVSTKKEELYFIESL